MATLFDPLQVGDLNLPNRIIMAPMTRSRATSEGVPTDIMPVYYRQRASAGLIITEATYVHRLGDGYERIPGMENDTQEARWKPVTDAVHDAGGRIFLQLFHVGRVAHPYFTGGAQPIAPSPITAQGQVYTDEGMKDFVGPRALETDEIPEIIGQFRQAAERAIRAGFDGVELHSASGYLHHQFLAGGSNQRTDAYGGSPEKRARFAIETMEALTGAIGSQKVGIKLSPEMPFNNISGDEVETYQALLSALSSMNLAYVHVGRFSGTDWHGLLRPKYTGTFFAGTGFDREKGTQILEAGGADAVVYGSLFLANPDLPERFRQNAPLNQPDKATFYAPGPEGFHQGYIDYPTLTEASAKAK